MRVACLLLPEEAPLLSMAEACFSFTSKIALRTTGDHRQGIFLEIGGSRRLYREESLIARLPTLCRNFNCVAQIAVADTVPDALYRCLYPQEASLGRDYLPLEALLDMADPFQPDSPCRLN